MGLVYDSRELTRVTTTKPGVTRVLQMVSEPTLAVFKGAYRSVEKDTVAYGSRTWVRTHDTWSSQRDMV
jgi:hypothetical protein